MKKFKFGDKVKIIDFGFYRGAPGIVIGADNVENKYAVSLEYNQVKYFYEHELMKNIGSKKHAQ